MTHHVISELSEYSLSPQARVCFSSDSTSSAVGCCPYLLYFFSVLNLVTVVDSPRESQTVRATRNGGDTLVNSSCSVG